MPFVSRKQQRWGNSASGLKALGGESKVQEWNKSTPKGSLREVAKKNGTPKTPQK